MPHQYAKVGRLIEMLGGVALASSFFLASCSNTDPSPMTLADAQTDAPLPTASVTCTISTLNAPASVVAPTFAEVRGVFAKNCAVGGCHLSEPGSAGLVIRLRTEADLNLLAVSSTQNPSMKLVEPGNVEKSWIMHKIDGSLCGCKTSCGGVMPPSGRLEPKEREILDAWVALGIRR
jgi:hypothetical protein